MMHTAKYMHQILDLALPAYDELFEELDLENLVIKNGIMYIWNNQNIESRNLEIKIRDELGVDQQLLNPKEIHDLEPNIKPIYDGGVFYSYARHTNNPKEFFKNFLIYLFKRVENF